MDRQRERESFAVVSLLLAIIFRRIYKAAGGLVGSFAAARRGARSNTHEYRAFQRNA